MRQCCVYFGFGGLFQRTKALFAQAKQIGKFKWGQNARIIAAACVYIAARERDKPIRLAELAVSRFAGLGAERFADMPSMI